jgi:serine phosphatase RsbU (regulator of sigma subunit)/ligand-binding sensor domain-containing protein
MSLDFIRGALMNINFKIAAVRHFHNLGSREAKIFCLTLAFVLCLPIKSPAQQQKVKFEHISLEHGLSQSIVRVILQDSKGFLWFGTQDGLNKYDGYNFTVYKYDPFDSNSLSNTDIWAIYEAPTEPEALWIGTSGGLNRLDRETETVTRFQHDPNNPESLSNNFIQRIYEDKTGQLWVLTGDDYGAWLDRFDRKTGTFTHYRHHPMSPKSLSHSTVTAFFEDRSGTLWIGTPAGLNKFDRKAESFIHYRHDPNNANSLSYDFILSIFESSKEPGVLWIGTGDPQTLTKGGGLNRFDTVTGKFAHFKHDPKNPNSLSSDVVGPIHEDKHGTLWIGTARGLNRFDRETGTFSHFLPHPEHSNSLSNAIVFLYEDLKGTLWMTTPARDGVYRFYPSSGTFAHLHNDLSNPHSLSNDWVHTIYEDRSGVLWIGMEVGGLNKLDPYAQKFTTYAPEPNNPNSLSKNLVRAIYEDRFGILWVGVMQGGLNKIDRKTGTFTHYRHDPKKPNSLSNDNVWCIYESRQALPSPQGMGRDGTLWVGTFGGGLNRFDRDKEAFKHYRHDPNDPHGLNSDFVRAIYESRREPGVLWIGTEGGGLNRFDTKTEKFTHYRNKPGDPNSLSNNVVRAIHEDQAGNLWLGTIGGGLNKFDRKTKTFTRYLQDPDNPHSLASNAIQGIFGDESGILWLGTFDGGLNRFDPATETCTVFTEHNSGLCNNVVYGILKDAHGNLWLSTNGGICKFNPEANTFKTYDVDDGLQNREFNGQAFFKSKSGEMFFGGITGFNAFYPDSIRDNPFVPQIALTDFKLFNESVAIGYNFPLKKHISETTEIKLAYWQNDISIEFVALHYSHPEKNKYAYMLENYDEAWRDAGTRRTATYTNLDPGQYVFRVKGANNDGVWNEKEKSIVITITPPFWRTWWAFSIYLIGLIGLLYGFRVYELNREREKIRLRESELRAQAAEAQARAMQAENERQTLELEEARKLQLSMLPKTIPTLPNLDIAVYMQTAHEVGGDYYDFMLHEDGSLTAAIGDATGHGLQAGTMVAATKSLFNSLAHIPHPVPILAEASHALRGMGFHNLYMAMTIAKFKDHRMRLAVAGMPFTLIYRVALDRVEEVELKGMPLGSFSDIPYQWKEMSLSTGDTVLFMSDGLPERFNERGEVLGEERVKRLFEEAGHQSPEQIIEHLVDAGKAWANGQPQNDDVTLVVVKVK